MAQVIWFYESFKMIFFSREYLGRGSLQCVVGVDLHLSWFCLQINRCTTPSHLIKKGGGIYSNLLGKFSNSATLPTRRLVSVTEGIDDDVLGDDGDDDLGRRVRENTTVKGGVGGSRH